MIYTVQKGLRGIHLRNPICRRAVSEDLGSLTRENSLEGSTAIADEPQSLEESKFPSKSQVQAI